jgi:hypothetical protein
MKTRRMFRKQGRKINVVLRHINRTFALFDARDLVFRQYVRHDQRFCGRQQQSPRLATFFQPLRRRPITRSVDLRRRVNHRQTQIAKLLKSSRIDRWQFFFDAINVRRYRLETHFDVL